MQSEDKRHDGGEEGESAGSVELGELGLRRQLGLLPIRHVQKEYDDGQGNGSEGEVDVEAPAPRDVGREGAADQGPENGRNAKDGADHALPEGPPVQGHIVDDDGDAAGEDACRADALDGPAEDEGDGIRGGAAHGRPDLEQKDGDGVDSTDGVEPVQLAKQQLEGA